ncbi:hypothetical protein BDV26DRAFT_154735 [Aspergillus bertholletiae]|uniref:Uncharacterized protein n=1 Tax=Aspergillus bertholletiae TaxID=1226010 RepID=A0A5N7BDH3_9EURO|nr:hypothetical protein BDV26DRAFT_154735 [Aspergillus bertholletiae]
MYAISGAKSYVIVIPKKKKIVFLLVLESVSSIIVNHAVQWISYAGWTRPFLHFDDRPGWHNCDPSPIGPCGVSDSRGGERACFRLPAFLTVNGRGYRAPYPFFVCQKIDTRS